MRREYKAQENIKEMNDIDYERMVEENLIREDRKENVKRIQRMQDYQRDKLKEKINEKLKRADKIKVEKK